MFDFIRNLFIGRDTKQETIADLHEQELQGFDTDLDDDLLENVNGGAPKFTGRARQYEYYCGGSSHGNH